MAQQEGVLEVVAKVAPDRGERLLRINRVVFQSTDQRDRNVNVELLYSCGHTSIPA